MLVSMKQNSHFYRASDLDSALREHRRSRFVAVPVTCKLEHRYYGPITIGRSNGVHRNFPAYGPECIEINNIKTEFYIYSQIPPRAEPHTCINEKK